MGKQEQHECCKRKESGWCHGVIRRDNSWHIDWYKQGLSGHSYLVYLWFYELFQWSRYALPHSSQIWVPVLKILSILLYQLHDQCDTHKFKDVSISKIPRDGFFPLSMISRKNLSGTTAFRKLKIHQWFLCQPKSKNSYKIQIDWKAT